MASTIRSAAVTSPQPHHTSLERAVAAARTAADNRGRDVVILDMRELTSECDYFVLATGSSRRQLHAMSEEIDRVLEREMFDQRLGVEGYAESRWILLDYGDVIVHLFDPLMREYYDLENLWVGAPHVAFEPSIGVVDGHAEHHSGGMEKP